MVAARALQSNSKKETLWQQVNDLVRPTTRKQTIVPFNFGFFNLLMGDHKAVLLLNQIIYWSDRTDDPQGWFYKTYADWQSELGLSRYEVSRIVHGDARIAAPQRTLKSIGVETVVRKARFTGNPTVHYRINREVLLNVLADYMQKSGSVSAKAAQNTPQAVMQHPDSLIGETLAIQTATVPQPEPPQSSTSSNPEITTEKESSEKDSINPHPPPDDDSESQIFTAYIYRFGKLKKQLPALLSAELQRLGAERVGQVLERCATRGRSWIYVLRALENEMPPPTAYGIAFDCPIAVPDDEGTESVFVPEIVAAPEIPASPRIHAPTASQSATFRTPFENWSAAHHQMQMQFGAAGFLVDEAVLVDFDAETAMFTVVVRNENARDQLQLRYYRTVRRIMSDIFGRAASVRFVAKADWSLPENTDQHGG
ncbi:MAG: hypothetical protein ABI700_13310 [Chloroflexota bacterium]